MVVAGALVGFGDGSHAEGVTESFGGGGGVAAPEFYVVKLVDGKAVRMRIGSLEAGEADELPTGGGGIVVVVVVGCCCSHALEDAKCSL
jgi:hypothetical protein